VGVAIWVPGQEPTYLAWGHPSENNCTFGVAHEYLQRIIKETEAPLLFHNAPFDLSVLEHTFCNAIFSWLNDGWKRIHDTMFLLFLKDPYSDNLGLKPSADRYLDMPNSEQDELHSWILRNIPEATAKTAGAYIARAPGSLVSSYAVGDVVRTRRLFDLLYPQIVESGMENAYDRERHLLHTMMRATRRGILIDRDTLHHHEQVYTECREIARDRLAGKLQVPESHIDSDELFADALESAGAVESFVLTKTGKRSLAKDNLKITNPEVKVLYEYISGLDTCLSVFMRPWLEKSAMDGRLHPNWNQVRQPRDAKHSKGTRTGRLSSDDPNFQNVSNEFVDSMGSPLPTPEGLHPIPLMRRYCLPDPGYIWLKRDFSGQELRILAHFEDEDLARAYRANAKLDPHRMGQERILDVTGTEYSRPTVKITGFSVIYGTGYGGLAQQLGVSVYEARIIKDGYLAAMPGIETLMTDITARGRSGIPIRTWGGRLYYAEPSKFVEKYGRHMSFEYKLLNYLIQGSASDQTKDSIVEWADTKKPQWEFLATVHDENNIQAPVEEADEAMEHLRLTMDADRFDVPFRSEGYRGFNWQDLEKENG
jgi:DNA polymerase I-like protein with 3'-5' exonuclease and polymerase domains